MRNLSKVRWKLYRTYIEIDCVQSAKADHRPINKCKWEWKKKKNTYPAVQVPSQAEWSHKRRFVKVNSQRKLRTITMIIPACFLLTVRVRGYISSTAVESPSHSTELTSPNTNREEANPRTNGWYQYNIQVCWHPTTAPGNQWKPILTY